MNFVLPACINQKQKQKTEPTLLSQEVSHSKSGFGYSWGEKKNLKPLGLTSQMTTICWTECKAQLGREHILHFAVDSANFFCPHNKGASSHLLSCLHHHFSQTFSSVQFSSVTQSCPTLCNPMNRSTPGLAVHHQLPEFTQTHVHRVGDAI